MKVSSEWGGILDGLLRYFRLTVRPWVTHGTALCLGFIFSKVGSVNSHPPRFCEVNKDGRSEDMACEE